MSRLVMANHGAVTMEGPWSQGSIRMLYGADEGLEWWSDGGCRSGEKRKRKLQSALRCLTVTDMTEEGDRLRARDQRGSFIASLRNAVAGVMGRS